ncbi:sugar-binding domain-containing protein [Nocardiopsis tropica]|nr:sugar-binding domain-containing protein [Nocardiopsis tropica]
MKPAFRPAELIRATAIARRYYIAGESKIRIAEDFGISRFKVARILDDARAAGIVRIEIAEPTEVDTDLSHQLRTAYGLHQAIAVVDPGEGGAMHRGLGRIAAEYLTEILEEDDTLGLACSRTLNAMTLALDELPRCTVVQLTGVLPGGVEENSVELVRRVASLARGPAYPIYAPLVVSDPATADALREVAGEADGAAGDTASRAGSASGASGASLPAPAEALAPVRDLLERGRSGHGRIPGKHGTVRLPEYTVMPVVIPDEPGTLGRLFAAAADAGVNIEDVRIEHTPGLPLGVAQLYVLPEAVDAFARSLAADGWSVHPGV